MENNKDVDCACDAFSFSMNAMLVLSWCLSLFQCHFAVAQCTKGRDACVTLPTVTYHDAS